MTALHEVIKAADVARTRRVLAEPPRAGLRPANIVDANGESPLHCVINSACVGLLQLPGRKLDLGERGVADRDRELLLEKGAITTLTDRRGFTPLLLASRVGFTAAVKLLLAHGANVQARLPDGNNALPSGGFERCAGSARVVAHGWPGHQYHQRRGEHHPQHRGVLPACRSVELLLRRQANPNIANRDEYAPLHWVAFKNDLRIAQRLVEYGANPGARDDRGISPLDEARKQGNTQVVALLEKHMSNVPASKGVKVKCPHCGSIGAVSGSAPGKKVKCKNGHVFEAHGHVVSTAPAKGSPAAKPTTHALSPREQDVAQRIRSLEPVAREVCAQFVLRSIVDPNFPGSDPTRDLLGLWGIALRSRGIDTTDPDYIEANMGAAMGQLVVVNQIAISVMELFVERASQSGLDVKRWLADLGLKV